MKWDRLGVMGLALVALGPVGCGGGNEEAPQANTDSSASTGGETQPRHQSAAELLGITPPDSPWAQMSHEEKEWYMVGKVTPIMKEMFKEFDAEEFADFGCETCHGPDGAERQWHMPTAALPPVPPPGTPENQQMNERHPRDVAFMATDVTPTMMTLLGLEPFNPSANTGFGCYGCHTDGRTPVAEAEPPAEEPPTRGRRGNRGRRGH